MPPEQNDWDTPATWGNMKSWGESATAENKNSPFFCAKCNKDFQDQQGLDSHNSRKHPPVYECLSCNRSFKTQDALNEHFRCSKFHPICTECGRGFEYECDLFEHKQDAHPHDICFVCKTDEFDGYPDALEKHIEIHPTCSRCMIIFLDEADRDEASSARYRE
ncbi:hypothetical protein C8J56DRAFT_893709 [Mycena floridula]|nr:hypothetical protein C8J56DRAFT_893709 [Mycena floridula]